MVTPVYVATVSLGEAEYVLTPATEYVPIPIPAMKAAGTSGAIPFALHERKGGLRSGLGLPNSSDISRRLSEVRVTITPSDSLLLPVVGLRIEPITDENLAVHPTAVAEILTDPSLTGNPIEDFNRTSKLLPGVAERGLGKRIRDFSNRIWNLEDELFAREANRKEVESLEVHPTNTKRNLDRMLRMSRRAYELPPLSRSARLCFVVVLVCAIGFVAFALYRSKSH